MEHSVVLKRNSAKLKMTTPFTDTTNLITADHILKSHSDLEHRFKTTPCSRITWILSPSNGDSILCDVAHCNTKLKSNHFTVTFLAHWIVKHSSFHIQHPLHVTLTSFWDLQKLNGLYTSLTIAHPKCDFTLDRGFNPWRLHGSGSFTSSVALATITDTSLPSITTTTIHRKQWRFRRWSCQF